MKRITAIALATGAVALALTGCGGSDEAGADANGLRKGTSGTSTTPATSTAHPSSTAPDSTTTDGAPTTTKAAVDTSSLGPASRTTCAEFKNLEGDDEKSLIEQVLAENPGSPFDGSPNVALGTAKLVCLSPSYADTPVAVAAGIVEKDK